MSTTPAIYWIDNAAQIRALESPMRQELVDAITVLGPCSISDLAQHLGRAADSLYFHIKKLVQVKLVQEVERRKEGRHESAIYAIPGRTARIVYRSSVAKSVRKVVAGAMRLSLREFQQAIVQKNACFAGPQRNLWGGRAKGWLHPSDLAEVNRLLEQLSSVLTQHGPGEGREVYSLGWVFSPAQVRPRARKQLLQERKGK